MESNFYLKTEFELLKGIFIERLNRFVAVVKLKGRKVRCHLHDPGRLKAILVKGNTVLVRIPKDSKKINRSTEGTLIGVKTKKGIWVSVDSLLANRFVKYQWRNLPIINVYESMKPEYRLNGKNRLDFCFFSTKHPSPFLVEVKTVTLVNEENIALFPDAPTKRGVRHLKELISARKKGYRTAVLFIVPRSDAVKVRPNFTIDPHFSMTLIEATRNGVETFAFLCPFNEKGIIFSHILPVELQ